MLLARLIEELRAVTASVDLLELRAQGIVQPDGDGWWRCANLQALPHGAAVNITAMEQDCIGLKVRFGRLRLKGLCREMEKTAARWGLEVPTTGPGRNSPSGSRCGDSFAAVWRRI